MNDPSQPIVSIKEFIQATRESGYRSTAAAVAELIDNALEARATRIWIDIEEEKAADGRRIVLAVLDNGHGMDPPTLQKALQFGGSSRFNERSGLGRFGMGLPNSSLSQCCRVDVFSWTAGTSARVATLDVDEIVAGRLTGIPVPQEEPLPARFTPHAGQSGTLVVWRNCDRLDYKKARTIAEKLHRTLGRVFRYPLLAGTELRINGERVKPIDPLFLSGDRRGAQEVNPPLTYPVRPVGEARADGAAAIRVRFSLLPVADWHDLPQAEKRARGITNGAGVSIVRAGREIAAGWYFMGRKRRQNYDDWWRAEIAFDPSLDEWFGVTHTKQGIRPTAELLAFLSPDIERMAHRLNGEVQAAFAELRRTAPSRAVQNARKRDWRFLPLPPPVREQQTGTPKLNRKADGLSYKVEVRRTGAPPFFEWEHTADGLSICLNEDHPFYRRMYRPAVEEKEGHTRFNLETLLLAYGRAALQAQGDSQPSALLNEWSHILAGLLE